jgi:hypothetical protein
MTAIPTDVQDFPELVPDIGVPYEKNLRFMDLRDRAMAACATAKDLSAYGLNLDTTEEDNEIAAILAEAYAQDPEQASKDVTHTRAATLRPASLVLTGSILDEYGQRVVQNSLHIRHLVTNRLILESDNPDARVRLRALELLGKISDVGLFTEKKEITVTHQNTDDLRATLKDKLGRLIVTEQPAEAEYTVVED